MAYPYELIVVRYREKEEDSTKRTEFTLGQEEKAQNFYDDLKEKEYAFVEKKNEWVNC